jgi:hypothetical protein
MPVCGDQDPRVLADFGQEGLVGGSRIWPHILLVGAISNASSVELVLNLWTIPVFVEVEG